ncbi:hypothetical protein BC826DRAFT_421861 [Russula brevipes]|nr:hypothetical protein BC826DRAFT_421861 [Russula brevipes]
MVEMLGESKMHACPPLSTPLMFGTIYFPPAIIIGTQSLTPESPITVLDHYHRDLMSF